MTSVLASVSQDKRLIRAVPPSPLTATDLIPVRVVGTEELSSPFLYTVDFISTDPNIGPQKMLGKPVALTLAPPGFSVRNVHGVVRRWTDRGSAGAAGFEQYQAEVVPSLWMLTLSGDCRTFENKSVRDIVDAVLTGAGVTNFRFRLSSTPAAIPYVTQYQESDFAFVSRLLEDAGLYYTFIHSESGHTLVISDSLGQTIPAGGKATLAVAAVGSGGTPGKSGQSAGNALGENAGQKVGDAVSKIAGDKLGGVIGAGVGTIIGPLGTLAGGALGTVLGGLVDGLFSPGATPPAGDTVSTLQRQRAVHTHTFLAKDFHLLRAADSASASSTRPGVAGTRFEYLGDLAGTDAAGVATATTTRRIETEETQGDLVRGTSTAASLTAGTRVTITGGVLGSDGLELHVTHVAHVAEISNVFGTTGGEQKNVYLNEFVAIPAATRYTPARVTTRPSVRGTQTARVVGPGETGEIDVDKDGRVLLQFPWDRGAGADKKSQHRVHVAMAWAGAGWGAVYLPRIGQEVLVEFLEGDPDRPIVTGRVYSNTNAVPYTLPDNKTQSGTKSRTLGGGAENFNELRFEDKKGSEHVFLQAEKNLQVKVKADETRTVGHDRVATVGHLDHHLVTGDKDADKNEQKLKVTDGKQLFIVEKGSQFMEIHEGDQRIMTSDGAQYIANKKGNQVFTVLDGNQTTDVKQGDQTIAVSGTIDTSADTIKLTGKTKIELTVGLSSIVLETTAITIKCGPSKIVLDVTGVAVEGLQLALSGKTTAKLEGPLVTVEGKAMTELKSALTQVTGSGLLKLAGGVTMAG